MRRKLYATFISVFQSSGHTVYVEDVCITFTDKTDPFIPTKLQDYWRQKLKTWLHMALILRKVFSCLGYNCCFVQIFFNIFDARPLVLGLSF